MASDNLNSLIKAIKEDNEHGALWLSNEAVRVLIRASQREEADNTHVLHEKIWKIGVRLAKSRPSMAPVINKIGYLFSRVNQFSEVNEYRAMVREIGTAIINSSENNKKLISENLEKIIGEVESVFTHSYSDTVFEVVRKMRPRKVVVTESRPLLEGKKLAHELGEEDLDIILIVDGAMDSYISIADICLIGADSVQYDGSVVNKIGSKLLAYSAREHEIPFYVICDTSKFNVINFLGQKIEIRENPPKEVSESMKNVTIKNIYFEIVPPELITGIITEEGLMKPQNIRRKMKLMLEYIKPLL